MQNPLTNQTPIVPMGASGGLSIKKVQHRVDEVNDAFYEQLVYENLECIINKYQNLQKEENENKRK